MKATAPRPATQSVIVSHPGTQHSYQTALGLQEAGMLKAYVTGFYYKSPSVMSASVRMLPSNLRSKVERQLNRRRNEHLDQDLIRTVPVRELMFVASTKSRRLARWANALLIWRNEHFDAHVARLVTREQPSAVICYASCGIKTLHACKKSAAVGVLDQTTGHAKACLAILRDEAHLHPEFADSFGIALDAFLSDGASDEALAADFVLAPSEFVRDTLIANGVAPSKIVVLPYGVDTQRFRPIRRHEQSVFRVLFVGAISQRKGVKYLLEAFRRLALPNAELVMVGPVVGSGEGARLYSDSFTHVTHVPYREVHSVFQNADIFVYPALFEGSALAIYEALSSGLPVITTPNAGSVVRNDIDGFIVPIRDVEALMQKILVLYRDRALRKTMSDNARERAENYTWAQYRRRLARFLAACITARKA